jgi:RNA polymerase sigma-70 factor (ECF subfamily)
MSLACLQNKHRSPSATAELQEKRQSGWNVLYLTHRPAVYGRCRRLLGDAHAAEDAAQETFARSFVHLQSIVGVEHQRRWLLRVATNYCLNQLRDRKRQTELLLQLDTSRVEDSAAALAARDVAVCATRALPDEVRRVAWLLYVDDMRQHQVAKALGISRRTVVNRLAAFRSGVRRAMAKMSDHPEQAPRKMVPERAPSAVQRLASV